MSFNQKAYREHWFAIARSKHITASAERIEPIPLSIFDRLTSTNTKVWSLIEAEDKCPLGAIALQQTAGKGQWGHSWVSEAGGLYLSIGLDLDLDVAHYPHLVMATAWGIATVLRHYQLPVTIKWFNDLILDRHKLGGIKIEARNNKVKLTKAVVGVGINWRNPVPKPGINLESYYHNKDINKINSLEELTAIAAYGILLGYKYYLAVGIEQILSEYMDVCSSIGKQIKLDGCNGEVVGVTREGKLKVKLRSPGASSIIELAPRQISLGYDRSLNPVKRGKGSK